MKQLIYILSKIQKKTRISSIKNSNIHKTAKIEANSSFVNSSIKKYSFCGYNCDISDCQIGSFVSIADNVIIGGGVHPMEWVGMSPVFYVGRDSVKKKFSNFSRPIPLVTIIGSDVWIGNNVIIKQGVRIGDGAVIGMGSVITKDVEDYAIVAGVPGKEIRKRFDDQIIESLLRIKWWDFPDGELEIYANYIQKPHIFIKEYDKNEKNSLNRL